MSWDLFLQHVSGEYATVESIPSDYSPPAIGSREELIRKLHEAIPEIDFSDPSWGILDGPGYSIEISIGERAELRGIALHVRGAGEAIPIVSKIVAASELRAIDAQTGEFFSEEAAEESFRGWQAYRDRVTGQNGGA